MFTSTESLVLGEVNHTWTHGTSFLMFLPTYWHAIRVVLLYVVQGQPQATMSCLQLHKKAERIGAYLIDKMKMNMGDQVALVYAPGLDLISAFYGCLYAGELPSRWIIDELL